MVATTTRVEESLTGAIRERKGWFGRRVLQVEVQRQSFWNIPPPPAYRDPDGIVRKHLEEREPISTWNAWRDATAKDYVAIPKTPEQVAQMLKRHGINGQSLIARLAEGATVMKPYIHVDAKTDHAAVHEAVQAAMVRIPPNYG